MLNYLNLFLAIVCLWLNRAYSQDTLLLKNKNTVVVKVTEVGLKTISYKKYSNPKGPLYTLEKNNIEKIIYSNGTTEKSVETKTYELRFNKIQIVASDLLIPRVSCTYERLFFKGLVGLEIPFMFSLEKHFSFETPFEEFVNDEFLYSTGLNVNIYPLRQTNVSYFIGPGFRTGKTFFYRYNYSLQKSTKYENLFYHIYITNGIAVNITKSFGITSFISVGMREVIGAGEAYPMSIAGTSLYLNF